MMTKKQGKSGMGSNSRSPSSAVQADGNGFPTFNILLIAGVVIFSMTVVWFRDTAEESIISISDDMRARGCVGGSVATPTIVERVVLTSANINQHPSTILQNQNIGCPISFALFGDWWKHGGWNFDEIERSTPDRISFNSIDSHLVADFTYVDNTTALASETKLLPSQTYIHHTRRKKAVFFKAFRGGGGGSSSSSSSRSSSSGGGGSGGGSGGGGSDSSGSSGRGGGGGDDDGRGGGSGDGGSGSGSGSSTTVTSSSSSGGGGGGRHMRLSSDLKDWPTLQKLVPSSSTSTLAPAGTTSASVTLWLSTKGVCSTAHYDSFDNLYVVVSGKKVIRLSSPTSLSRAFAPFPIVHPHARQAQRVFPFRADGEGRTKPTVSVTELDNVGMWTTTLNAGEALYIPAGWVHEVESITASASISFTTLPDEYTMFTNWVKVFGNILPFVVGEGWGFTRVASVFVTFIPAVLKSLGYPGPLSQSPLGWLVQQQYSAHVKTTWQWRERKQLARDYIYTCDSASESDQHAASRSVEQISAFFLKMRPHLRVIYFQTYLETILSKLGGNQKRLTDRVAAGIHWAEKCLLT